MLPALHRTIWCRSTFGPRGPGLSNPTSFLRPAPISKFLRPAQRYDDFKSLAKPLVMAKLNMAYWCRSTFGPRGPGLSNPTSFLRPAPISKFLRPAQRYDDFKSLAKPLVMAKLNMAYLSSLKKTSKTAVVLLAGVTISGTPCSRHFTVPFGAEAPSDHVVQA